MNRRLPREDEAFCKDAFLQWLGMNDPQAEVSDCIFEPIGPTTFPDFTVYINGQIFNLEVTILEEFSTKAMSNMHNGFTKQLEMKAKQTSMLCGTYELVVERIVPDFKVQRESLERQILHYLEQTKNDESSPWARIVHEGETMYLIKKHAKSPDGLFPGGPDRGGWDDDIRQRLSEAFSASILRKQKHAEKANDPTILLLFDQYHLAENKIWFERAEDLAEKNTFHTIFVAQNPALGKGFILYSEDENWLAKPVLVTD